MDREVRFPAADATSVASRVSVTSRSGRVEVVAEPRADIEVAGARRAVLERDDAGEHVLVDGKHEHIIVHCPVGTDLFVGTLSGRVAVTGRLGAVRVTTSSGRVDVGEAVSVDVRTRSGTIRVARCEEGVRARSTSARVTVEVARRLDATTATGAIVAGSVRDASVQSTSGRVELGLQGDGSVAARTVSGRVEISVPAGARPEMLLRSTSGHIEVSLESGVEGTIGVQTVSGRIRVRPR
jgi:Putative adhesin